MQNPELVNQLKERLPEALFEKLNGSLSIDLDRLRFAEYKVRVLEERLRLVRIEKYGPGSEKLSDAQLELLELEPGVSSAEVEAESQREQLQVPLNPTSKVRIIGRSGLADVNAPSASIIRKKRRSPERRIAGRNFVIRN
jgi:Transposase C of IS166 homeodomain